MLHRFAFPVVFAASLYGCAQQPAKLRDAPLQGASRALDALGSLPQHNAPEQSLPGCAPDPPAESKPSIAREVLQRIDRYASEGRAGVDAEKAWFALYAAYRSVPIKEAQAVNDSRTAQPLSVLSLVVVLPEPVHWPAMRRTAKSLAKRSAARAYDEHVSALALGLLFDSLLNDTIAQGESLRAMQAAAAVASKERREQAEPIIAEWRKHLTVVAGTYDPIAESMQKLDGANPDEDCCTFVDSLIDKAGEARARAFLEHALFERRVVLGFDEDDGMLALAQRLAMEQPTRLARVQWGLVGGTRTLELFYAMAGLTECRQGSCAQTAPPDFDRALELAPRFVRGRLLRPLIEAGEDEHAERLLLEASDTRSASFELTLVLESMVNAGRGQRALDFDRFLLTRHPSSSYWSSLNAFAYTTDQRLAARAYEILGSAPTATPDLEQSRMILNRSIVADANGGDDVAATALRLQQRLALPVASAQSESYSDDPRLARTEAAVQLADLGRLEKRDDWSGQGLTAVEQILAETRSAAYGKDEYHGDSARDRALTAAVRLLQEDGRLADAEKLLFDELAAIGITCRSTDMAGCRDRFASRNSGADSDTAARLLMALYAGAGKDGDARMLVDRYALWQNEDAAGLSIGMGCDCGSHPAIAVARSLSASGDGTRAANLLQQMLHGYDASPEAARLFGRIAGTNATATILQDHGKERGTRLAMASLAASGAGETERARQLAVAARKERVYFPWREALDAVFVDAAVAAGDMAAAQRWRESVQALALAERANRYEQLGVASRSRALFAQALAMQQAGDCVETWMLDFARKRGDHAAVSALLRRMVDAAAADADAIGCLKGYLSLTPQEYAALRTMLHDAARASPSLASALPTLMNTLDAYCPSSSSDKPASICLTAAQRTTDQNSAYAAAKQQVEKDSTDADALQMLYDFTRRSVFSSLYGGHMDGPPTAPEIEVDAAERDDWAMRLVKQVPSRLPNGIAREAGEYRSHWSPVVLLADYWHAAFDAAQHLPPEIELPAYPLAASRDYGSLGADGSTSSKHEQATRQSRPALDNPAVRAGLAVGSTEIVMMAVRLIEPVVHDPCTMCI
jgi:hypothetical protein